MSLTEKEKKHIEEEEAYRAKIKEETQYRNQISSQPKKKGVSGCLIAIVIILAFPIFLAITLIAINPEKQFEQAEQQAILTPESQDPSAIVGKHAYNKTNGAYRGEILEVKPCNTAPELTCYVVNQPTFMRPIEAPADNSIVRGGAPNTSELQ
jgi:hypothetical protein